jgi:hypothetical protein
VGAPATLMARHHSVLRIAADAERKKMKDYILIVF